MKNFNILISGASGVTSRSVVRSLKMSLHFQNARFVGMDNCDNKYGIFEGLYDRFYKVQKYDSVDYHSTVESIIALEKIDVAIIIPELEVIEWSKYNFSTKYIVPPHDFCVNVINKAILYEHLKASGLVPNFELKNRTSLLDESNDHLKYSYPLWIRDFSSGSTSGKGAFKVENLSELRAWVIINRNIDEFILTSYLDGGNFACHLLYDNGNLIKIACYERLTYFMSRVSPSGITGNISEGKLINDISIVDASKKAVEIICQKTNSVMNGIIAVDLKKDSNGKAYITEINIRHVAATSAFASAGFNIAEFQLLLALGMNHLIPDDLEKTYPDNNLILRDIDGLPIWISDFNDVGYGESF